MRHQVLDKSEDKWLKVFQVSQTATFSVTVIEVGGEMHIYNSGEKTQQTVLLCNVGHGIQRF